MSDQNRNVNLKTSGEGKMEEKVVEVKSGLHAFFTILWQTAATSLSSISQMRVACFSVSLIFDELFFSLCRREALIGGPSSVITFVGRVISDRFRTLSA